MRQLRRGTGPPCLMATARASIQGKSQGSALGTPAEFSGVGFLGRRSLVPVGAGVVMGWVGTLVVARVSISSPGMRGKCDRMITFTAHPMGYRVSKPEQLEAVTPRLVPCS